jgi:hypothetical protein
MIFFWTWVAPFLSGVIAWVLQDRARKLYNAWLDRKRAARFKDIIDREQAAFNVYTQDKK